MLKSLVVVVALVCAAAQVRAADPVPTLNGWWKNQLGSVMVLQYDAANSKLTGKYRTGTSTTNTFYELNGLVNGDLIVITVNWSKPTTQGDSYNTLTTWVGQHIVDPQGKPQLKTTWLYQQSTPDADENDPMAGGWNDVVTGSDTFEETQAPPNPKPNPK